MGKRRKSPAGFVGGNEKECNRRSISSKKLIVLTASYYPLRNDKYMKGVIRPDTPKMRCTECGGKFEQVSDAQFTHPVPKCIDCKQSPKHLKVRVTLPALGKVDVRYNLKGTRIDKLALADAFLTDVHDDIKTGKFNPNDYLSPKQRKQFLTSYFLDQFLNEKMQFRGIKKGCSPAYVDDAESLIRLYLNPFFGEMEIAAIRYVHLKNFMINATGTERQRSKALAILRTIMKEASKSVLDLKVPEFPPLPASKMKKSFIDIHAQDLILSHVKNHYLAIKMLTIYPIRPCDIRALQWRDIDFKNGIMTIRRHFSQEKLLAGRKSTFDPNDRYHELPLRLSDDVKDGLRQMCRSLIADDFVFKTKSGKPLYEKALYKEWVKACKRAGVTVCPLYDGTKHATMTYLNQEEGISIDHLGALAGQTISRTTNRYVAADSIRLSDCLIKKRRGGKGVDVSNGNK